MSKTYFIGMEASNGNCKITSNVNVGKVDTYLNTLTVVKDPNVYFANQSSIDSMSNEQRENRDRSNDVYEITIPLDSKKYYYRVGKRPTNRDTKGFSTSGKNESKYYKKEWIIANLIGIYRQLENENFQGSRINLVTGLPTDFSIDETLKKDIIETLSKTYTVNGRDIRVSNVAILPQADASFYNDFLEFDGSYNEQFVDDVSSDDDDEETVIVYYDLGFGTTDVKTMVEFSIDPLRKTELDGMEELFIKMRSAAEKINPKLAGIDPLILDKHLRNGGIIDEDGIRVDITNARDEILQNFAVELIDVIDSTDFSKMKVTEHRFVGGGTYIMKDYIKAALQEKYARNPYQIDKYKLPTSNGAEDGNYLQHTNCLGFYKMCVRKYNK